MSKVKPNIGEGGSHVNTDLAQHLLDIVDSLNSLKSQVDDLQGKYNQHIIDGRHQVATAADAASPTSTITSDISISK